MLGKEKSYEQESIIGVNQQADFKANYKTRLSQIVKI